MWACLCCKDVYYKESVHTIMEADKSPDLSSASWRPRNSQCKSQFEDRRLKVIGQEKLPFLGESEVKVAVVSHSL